MQDLVVRRRCGSGAFLSHLTEHQSRAHGTIDLTEMSFCEPLGLVGIAAFADGAVRRGKRVVVLSPQEPAVANYLSRMHLGETLAALGAEHELPRVREHFVGDALLELTSFTGARGAAQLGRMVHEAMEASDLEAAAALHEGICEAGQNVAHHSGQPHGYIAAQRTHNRTRLMFAVSDCGVGMLGTLASKGARTDAEALDLALRRGASGTTDEHRGQGLPDILDQVSSLQGSLYLVSGAAAVTAWGRHRTHAAAALGLQGTIVQGSLRAPQTPSNTPRQI